MHHVAEAINYRVFDRKLLGLSRRRGDFRLCKSPQGLTLKGKLRAGLQGRSRGWFARSDFLCHYCVHLS